MKKLFLRSFLRAVYCCICLYLSYVPVHGQAAYSLEPIFEAYRQGHHQALRDVFYVLADHPENKEILAKVKKGMLIDFQDPSLMSMNPQLWPQYYYEHQSEIQFYPEWSAFLRNDLPLPSLPYAILDNYRDPASYITRTRQIYNALQQNKLKKSLSAIESLTFPEVYFSKRLLLESLEVITQKGSCEKSIRPFAAIAGHLLTIGDQYVFEQIHQLLSKNSCSTRIKKAIFQKTMDYKRNSSLYTPFVSSLQEYRKSQFTAHLKEQRLAEDLGISPTFFENKIDYYGKLFAALKIGDKVNEDELISLMINSESSKALYYIISRWFVYTRINHPRAKSLMNIITSFIDSDLQINTPDGRAVKLDVKTGDNLSQKSIFSFWINNYKHYEWNSDVRRFVNKNILKKDKQELIRLYKNLNGDNKDFALKSYWKLVHSDPILLAEVDKIYSKKLLKYNQSLPSRKYKYLLQLSRLVEYCKSNQIDYRLDQNIETLLDRLTQADKIADIVDLENKLIRSLNIDNITSFEIWAIVNSSTNHIRYSATRITNLFYKKHIHQIVQSEAHFKLFLKKSNIFKNFGDHGSSKYYLKKIIDNVGPSIRQLNNIKNESIDEDIIASIDYIIDNVNQIQPKYKDAEFHSFLKDPLSIGSSDLRYIKATSKHFTNKYITYFENKYSTKQKFRALEWVSVHMPKELLPFIVSLQSEDYLITSSQDIDVHVEEFANQIISNYAINIFEKEEVWPKEYYNVFKNIFQRNVKELKNAEDVTIEAINDIVMSSFYSPGLRPLIIKALGQVKPARNVTACKLSKKLSLKEFKYLLGKIESRNALNYLLKITDIQGNDEIMSFLIGHIKERGVEQAGRFFNSLFKKQWFTSYINDNNTSAELKTEIQWLLTNYWETEEGLSAFEEEQTVLNIIKIELAGKPLSDKMDLILESFVDNEIKRQTIKKIVHELDYNSIALMLDYYDQVVELGGLELYNFIPNDFGIPIEDISDRTAMQQLSYDLRNTPQKQIYIKYLSKIGVDLMDHNGHLDTPKAYNIITQDLVRPFVGTGGSVRDIYVFGTIKLLEFEFNRTLGFHPKLNESQSFYKYTSKKRAIAWAEELSSLLSSEL